MQHQVFNEHRLCLFTSLPLINRTSVNGSSIVSTASQSRRSEASSLFIKPSIVSQKKTDWDSAMRRFSMGQSDFIRSNDIRRSTVQMSNSNTVEQLVDSSDQIINNKAMVNKKYNDF